MRAFIFMIFFISMITGCYEEQKIKMKSTFQLPEGIKVVGLSGIGEAYSINKTADGYFHIMLNVSAENIFDFFNILASKVNEPAFLIYETGTNENIERKLRKNDKDSFHKDVYYIDGLNWLDAKAILSTYEKLLVHDGEINFGFGSHQGHDEIFVGPYKIFEIYADNPDKYISTLNELKIKKVERLKTVWDNFTQESPGQRRVLGNEPITIWQMIEKLKEKGLYLAEHRED